MIDTNLLYIILEVNRSLSLVVGKECAEPSQQKAFRLCLLIACLYLQCPAGRSRASAHALQLLPLRSGSSCVMQTTAFAWLCAQYRFLCAGIIPCSHFTACPSRTALADASGRSSRQCPGTARGYCVV